jgi:hypothetical protein
MILNLLGLPCLSNIIFHLLVVCVARSLWNATSWGPMKPTVNVSMFICAGEPCAPNTHQHRLEADVPELVVQRRV